VVHSVVVRWVEVWRHRMQSTQWLSGSFG